MMPDEDVAKLIRFILAVDEYIPWYTGYVYLGHTIKKQADGYFLVVRASRQHGERVVSFHGGHKPFDCWWSFAYDLSHHKVKWSLDKFG